METLAYLHCASTCEEIAPVEAVFGEDDAYLFDGVVSVKRLSSLALLGLLPLSVAFSVMANPNAAQAGGWDEGEGWGGGHHGGHGYVVTKHIFVRQHTFIKKVVWFKPLYYRHFRCYHPHYHRPSCYHPCFKRSYYGGGDD